MDSDLADALRDAQARYVIGDLPGEELPVLAIRLLEGGLDSPAIRELASLSRPTLRDAGSIFDRLLTEISEPALSRDEAIRVLGAAIARRVLSGGLVPGAAADKLGALWLQLGQPTLLDGYWELADEYECRPDDHAVIDEDVRMRLGEFLRHS